MTQEVAAEKSTSECCRQRVTTVDRPAGCRTTGQATPEHRLKMAVRVQVMQRTVLGEALGKVASLDGVQEQATVGTVEQPANLIEGESVEVAAALAEQFEPIRRRVIPPAPLLELDPADPAGRRAAIDPVQPASRSPRQVVGQGLGILHAEPLEQHAGWTVGDIVPIAIGVEEQVRNLQDVNTSVPEGESRGEIQPIDKVPGPVGPAVAVGVLENRDPVGSARPLRRRLGNAVVDRA